MALVHVGRVILKFIPEEFRRNPDLGIYIAETIRDGVVHETEMILDGYRADGIRVSCLYAEREYQQPR